MHRLIALLLCLALLLPAMGGALAVLAGAQSVVLCIGAERVRVTLDADGQPVEQIATTETECLTAPTSVTTAGVQPPANHPPILHRLPKPALPHAASIPAQNPARAPPLPV